MTAEIILQTLDSYANAYCDKDIEALMAVFDDSDDISVIGTGDDEICSGRAQVRELFLRNFSEAKANRFEYHWTHVNKNDNSAVVAVTLTIHLEIEGALLQLPIRWTVALRRRPSGWLWIHRHASTAAAGQDAGQAYPKSRSEV